MFSVSSGRAHSAVLDGETDLLFGREWPYFVAFDVLSINGKDLRDLPLHERKRRLARIMPWVGSRLILLEPIERHGRRLFELACERDREGIVAKWKHGTYQSDGRGTSWFKVKVPSYSQAEGRHELFESRRHLPLTSRRAKPVPPLLALR